MSKLSVTPNGLMQKPLKASDPLVPKSLVQLEKEMESIANGHGVVPEYLQAEMCDKTIDDCDFTTGMFDKNAAKYSDSHREVNLYDIIAIMASANNCQEDLLDEHTWNNHVHTPLLNAAFYGKYPCPPQLDGFLTCATATILPEYKIKAAPGKKVDYVAYINPDNDKAHPNARAIIDKYRANFAEDSINHTGYRKVTPISFSIETKRSDLLEDGPTFWLDWEAVSNLPNHRRHPSVENLVVSSLLALVHGVCAQPQASANHFLRPSLVRLIKFLCLQHEHTHTLTLKKRKTSSPLCTWCSIATWK
ncbi:uncharacterized protein FPRO_12510 [Fusarium proliferatum ET1]|uniref:PD-(D/E)XK nuclease-like domain-containing protein n=1 Tax=Fusarium proliferatum (strain ET1) TaxID=1227346 RepID=A0A1L7W904_FUSPR|nr:uncharacterized protein FPRO_12510 [Fusarium proliferatum ET1]CZR49073.1 uncharacterized protein FPRO_12510 [Fusarium proliferatum ET1]